MSENLTLHHILTASAGGELPRLWHPTYGIYALDTEQLFIQEHVQGFSDNKLVLRRVEDLTPDEVGNLPGCADWLNDGWEFDRVEVGEFSTHVIFRKEGRAGAGMVTYKYPSLTPFEYQALASLRVDLWGYIDKGLAVREKDIQQEGGKR